jgi:hypothetical protein
MTKKKDSEKSKQSKSRYAIFRFSNRPKTSAQNRLIIREDFPRNGISYFKKVSFN